MFESTRTRVAVRFTAFFAAVVFTIGACLYWQIHQNAYWRLDGSLDSTLDATRLALQGQSGPVSNQAEAEAAARVVLGTMARTAFPQDQLLIRDGSRVVAYKPSIGRRQYDLQKVNLPGQPDRFNMQDLRIVSTHFTLPGSRAHYLLSVSTWRGDVMNDLAALFQALATIIPLSLALIAAGGYYLAKRSLAPLVDMASAMDGITSTNLDRRIVVQNPGNEVGKLALGFNDLLERLQTSFVQQRRFMADASHELRTPLAAALTAAQVTLQESARCEIEYRDALKIVEEQLLRLRRIVSDMFLLARADTGSLPIRRDRIYFDELVAEACRAMKLIATNKGLYLSVGVLSEIVVLGDEGLIRQAIMILLDNACKYNAAGGSISVTLRHEDHHALLRVKDSGYGIPMDARPFLFDRFFRVDRSRSRMESDQYSSGAGLGLAIARWIADTHGGDIFVETSGESGSTFALSLPSCQAEPALATKGGEPCE